MGDRELLESAAKAAGIGLISWTDVYDACDEITACFLIHPCAEPWNPLTDDGDALRLAVKLGLEMGFKRSGYGVWVNQPWLNVQAAEDATMGYSIAEATRRAIVRAAAEIGKAMAPSTDGGEG